MALSYAKITTALTKALLVLAPWEKFTFDKKHK
jgi:hypothetical protein